MTSPLPKREWQEHATRLILETGLKCKPVQYVRGPYGEIAPAMYVGMHPWATTWHEICAPTGAMVRDREHYIGALHEVGHVQCGHENRNFMGDELWECEAEAWLWALDNALDPDPAYDEALAWKWFSTYLKPWKYRNQKTGPAFRALMARLGREEALAA